jgi:hypothetical protein
MQQRHLRRHDLILKCRHELLRLGEPKPKVSRASPLIALDAGNLGLRHLTRPELRHQFHPPHQLSCPFSRDLDANSHPALLLPVDFADAGMRGGERDTERRLIML